MIYLDANASEPMRPAARAAMAQALDVTGNPSSVHAAGRAARRLLEDCRERVARRFGTAAAGTVFTSGGTEADALAIHALGHGRRVLIGATEHDAIRAAAPAAQILPVDAQGVIDLVALQAALQGGPPALVCVMLANNETGTLQPIAAVAAMCAAAGARLHVDAAQAAGRMAVSLERLGAHSMAVSAHKLGGPGGAGALLLAPEAARLTLPLIAGGGQERGWRGGTQALAAIAGFAAALSGDVPDAMSGLAPLRDRIDAACVAMGGLVIGGGATRLGNTTCIALHGVAAQTQVMALDLAGCAVSAGAACSSGKVVRSHVLAAMGLGALAGEAIRVSLPWNASAADADGFIAAYGNMASRLARRAA